MEKRKEGFYKTSKDGIILFVHCRPNAKKTCFDGMYGDNALKLSLKAPPVDNKANKEAISYIAGVLGISKGDVMLKAGRSARKKSFLIRGITIDELLASINKTGLKGICRLSPPAYEE